MQIFTFLALAIAIALLIFSVQNFQAVRVSFLAYSLEGPLAMILAIVFGSGFVSGILVSLPALFRRGSAIRTQKRRVHQLEEEMARMTTHTPAQGNEPLT
ncbi:MAG: LapA family protein [Thermodesulfovibrionales bacterium]